MENEWFNCDMSKVLDDASSVAPIPVNSEAFKVLELRHEIEKLNDHETII